MANFATTSVSRSQVHTRSCQLYTTVCFCVCLFFHFELEIQRIKNRNGAIAE